MRTSVWFFTRPRAFGAHAVALDKAGRVLLVKHTYSRGWRLPGGGLKRGEEPQTTILRELREEIGLTSYGGLQYIYDFKHRPEFRRGTASLFLLTKVDFTPPKTIEIAEIGAFEPSDLPDDATELTRRLVSDAMKQLGGSPQNCV